MYSCHLVTQIGEIFLNDRKLVLLNLKVMVYFPVNLSIIYVCTDLHLVQMVLAKWSCNSVKCLKVILKYHSLYQIPPDLSLGLESLQFVLCVVFTTFLISDFCCCCCSEACWYMLTIIVRNAYPGSLFLNTTNISAFNYKSSEEEKVSFISVL